MQEVWLQKINRTPTFQLLWAIQEVRWSLLTIFDLAERSCFCSCELQIRIYKKTGHSQKMSQVSSVLEKVSRQREFNADIHVTYKIKLFIDIGNQVQIGSVFGFSKNLQYNFTFSEFHLQETKSFTVFIIRLVLRNNSINFIDYHFSRGFLFLKRYSYMIVHSHALYLWVVELLQFKSWFLVSFIVTFFPSLDVLRITFKKETKFSNDLIDNHLFLCQSQLKLKINWCTSRNIAEGEPHGKC